jgi:NAD(P)H-flavin reductase
MPIQQYRAKLIEKKQLTHKVVELVFVLISPEPLSFIPGQFLTLKLPSGAKRFYSIASLPDQKDSFVFCVDLGPAGEGSKYIQDLTVGDEVFLEGPHGVFVFKDHSKDHVCIATGAGVAPFCSMIEDALKKGERATLIMGVRSEKGIFYFDKFEKLQKEYSNFTFIPTLSRPEGDWQGRKGRVSVYINEHKDFFLNKNLYICGGPEMVKDVRANLIQLGIEPMSIKIEVYT